MYCVRCGAAIRDGAVFCPACGGRLGGTQDPGGYGNADTQARKKIYAVIIIAVAFTVAAVIIALLLGGVIPTGLGNQSNQQNDAPTPAEGNAGSAQEPAIEPSEEPGHMGDITGEALDYFCEVALNVEYGGADGVAKRWEEPIRIQVTGDYTAEDYAALREHIDALSGLGILPNISISDSDANYFIRFVPLDEMDDVIPGYVKDNFGYFCIYWDQNYRIYKAYMGIAVDVTSQKQRNHLILEELTQSLGLTDDSNKYADSIFQAEWTETQALSSIDWELIYILYGDDIHAGMKRSDVVKALSNKK